MKTLKLLFIPLVMVSLFSLANAADCTFDGTSYSCNVGEYCAGVQCDCNGSMINSGSTCGTSCAFDGVGYSCNAGEYCASTNPTQCDCNGSMIITGAVCGTTPPPSISCSYLGQTLFSGQTMQVFKFDTVPSTGTCVGAGLSLTLTCNNVGGTGILTPAYVGYNFSGCIVLPQSNGSCALPRGGTINSGSSIITYQASSVACGGTCTSQVRTCNDGILSGTYSAQSCSVASCGNGGGGGGGGRSTSTCTVTDLMCFSGSYQKKPGVSCVGGNLGLACSVNTGSNTSGTHLPVGNIMGSTYSTEINNAYLWAYAHSITTMGAIQKANMGGILLRAHMAKMISNFAITFGGLTPNTGKQCTFSGIANQSSEMKFYIKLSCQLGLMGIHMANFDPNGEVTRGQFGTILSRVIWGTTYNTGAKYYTSHLNALKLANIMTQISTPNMKELRGYVMLMMKRTYEGGFLGN